MQEIFEIISCIEILAAGIKIYAHCSACVLQIKLIMKLQSIHTGDLHPLKLSSLKTESLRVFNGSIFSDPIRSDPSRHGPDPTRPDPTRPIPIVHLQTTQA